MATLSVEEISESGLDATYNSAESGGDDFVNDSSNRIFLHVKNGDSSSHTVTVSAIASSVDIPGYGAMSKDDVSVSIPAGEDRFIGPFPRFAFGNTPSITYDAVTSMTVAVMKV